MDYTVLSPSSLGENEISLFFFYHWSIENIIRALKKEHDFIHIVVALIIEMELLVWHNYQLCNGR